MEPNLSHDAAKNRLYENESSPGNFKKHEFYNMQKGTEKRDSYRKLEGNKENHRVLSSSPRCSMTVYEGKLFNSNQQNRRTGNGHPLRRCSAPYKGFVRLSNEPEEKAISTPVETKTKDNILSSSFTYCASTAQRTDHHKDSRGVKSLEEVNTMSKKANGLSFESRSVNSYPNTRKLNGNRDENSVFWVFIIFFLIQVFINFDCGAIPCTLTHISEEFQLSPTWQGLLGALAYVGLTVASLCSGGLLTGKQTKRIIVFTLFVNSICTLAMTLTYFLPHSKFGDMYNKQLHHPHPTPPIIPQSLPSISKNETVDRLPNSGNILSEAALETLGNTGLPILYASNLMNSETSESMSEFLSELQLESDSESDCAPKSEPDTNSEPETKAEPEAKAEPESKAEAHVGEYQNHHHNNPTATLNEVHFPPGTNQLFFTESDGTTVEDISEITASLDIASHSEATTADFISVARRALIRVHELLSHHFYSFNDLTPSSSLLLISRLFIGLSQAPFVVYTPVWVDEFAPPDKAALWMGIMQGAAVVGVTVGYIFAGVLTVYLEQNWRWAVLIQSIILMILISVIVFLPQRLINSGRKRKSRRAVEVELSDKCPENVQKQLTFNDMRQQSSIVASETTVILSSSSQSSGLRVCCKSRSVTSIGHLCGTSLYVFPMLALCALFFVVTGIQFWGSMFLTTVKGISPRTTMITFAAVASTAPTAGVIGGGMIIDALGGYRTPKGRANSLLACLVDCLLAVLCAIAGAYTENCIVFAISLWLLLCLGGALLPPLTGIQMDSVHEKARTKASGLSMFLYNILGYSLGAFLPGLAMDLFQGGNLFALRLVLLWSIFSLFFTALSYFSALMASKASSRHVTSSPPDLELGDISSSYQFHQFETSVSGGVPKTDSIETNSFRRRDYIVG